MGAATISWGGSGLALRHAANIKRMMIVLVLFLVFSYENGHG